MLTIWFGMVFNIAWCAPFAIIDYRSQITCDIPILNVVAILSTSIKFPMYMAKFPPCTIQ